MAERGHFSLIQFVPDRGRAEGANVGVVVICPTQSLVRVKMCESNDGPKYRFGAGAVDEGRLSFAKSALEHRLLAELSGQPTLQSLERVRALEGNALVISQPRTVAIGDIDAVATSLLDDLVRIPETSRERAQAPDVESVVRALRQRSAAIQMPGAVAIPTTGESLKVAFAYQNGALNYVHSQGFGRNRATVLDMAKRLGAQGHLLYRGSAAAEKLVLLARFSVQEYKSTVHDICDGLDVRLVDEECADAFVEEVVRTAH